MPDKPQCPLCNSFESHPDLQYGASYRTCDSCGHTFAHTHKTAGAIEPTKPTHIMLEYPNHKSEILFRASDGIGIAQRKDAVVIIGEDPNKGTSRVFIDAQHAHRFISEVLPAFDLEGREFDWKLDNRKPVDPAKASQVKLEYKAGEGLIAIPSDVVAVPGGIRKMN
jgi:hypothetical protein